MKIPIPFLKDSTRAFIQEARKTPNFSLGNFIHGYIYGRWIYLYIGIGTGEHWLAKTWAKLTHYFTRSARLPKKAENDPSRVTFADTYHGKAVPLETARQLVMIQEDIRVPDLEQVIPYKRARALILNHPDHIAVLDCPCRSARENPCQPMDVCLVVGEPFASFIIDHNPKRARRISQDEAIDILTAEDARGHAHHVFFKEAMLQRYYAICNCCSCCCAFLVAINRYGQEHASQNIDFAIFDFNYSRHTIYFRCFISTYNQVSSIRKLPFYFFCIIDFFLI